DQVRVKLDTADGAFLLTSHPACKAAYEERDLAGRITCVGAQIHRRGAGVGGATGDRDLRPQESGDAFDRADGTAFVLQDRPLLDVPLQVGVRLGEAGARVAGVADPPQLVADRCAVDAAHRV